MNINSEFWKDMVNRWCIYPDATDLDEIDKKADAAAEAMNKAMKNTKLVYNFKNILSEEDDDDE
ncbi:MAG: hypothetical protein K6E85_00865 [Lachnospiraceae bacterium]|nr:hypothetical protein [Lachnospiraceae bacterium]